MPLSPTARHAAAPVSHGWGNRRAGWLGVRSHISAVYVWVGYSSLRCRILTLCYKRAPLEREGLFFFFFSTFAFRNKKYNWPRSLTSFDKKKNPNKLAAGQVCAFAYKTNLLRFPGVHVGWACPRQLWCFLSTCFDELSAESETCTLAHMLTCSHSDVSMWTG